MEKEDIKPVSFTAVHFTDTFWTSLLRTSRETTIPVCIGKCEETARIANFARAAGMESGEFEGIYYNDSDVYKVLEGVAYTLHHHRDPELEAIADTIIDKIVKSQQPDGYINSYFTLKGLDGRWKDMTKHEDYCGGHMMEAAIAYKNATGKRKFLDTAIRYADHLLDTFGPGKRHWVAGHQEIELALVKLYRETGKKAYLELAHWYLEERGHGHGTGFIWTKDDWGVAYCQDDKPVAQMEHISGHAVRAMYMYSAMADMVALKDQHDYLIALEKLWDTTVNRNMYITGGIGSSATNEGFTEDYDLPNDTAYCETCASVGMVLWNHRMFLLSGKSTYIDILERSMYNGSLSGVSAKGDTFFYDNPLESDGTKDRQPWFDSSCCPTQISRFIPSVGNYIYAQAENTLWINLFAAGSGNVTLMGQSVEVVQKTQFPWDGKIEIAVNPSSALSFDVVLRIPDWSSSFSITVNGASLDLWPATGGGLPKDGYMHLKREWKAGDLISLELDMTVRRVYADPRVKADLGKVALQRGALVYCFEETDNDAYDYLHVSKKAVFLISGKTGLPLEAVKIDVLNPDGSRFTAIPYFAWNNRGSGRMKVWAVEAP